MKYMSFQIWVGPRTKTSCVSKLSKMRNTIHVIIKKSRINRLQLKFIKAFTKCYGTVFIMSSWYIAVTLRAGTNKLPLKAKPSFLSTP